MSWDNYFDTVSAILTAEAINDISEACSARRAAIQRQDELAQQVQSAQNSLNAYFRQVGCPMYYIASKATPDEINRINSYRSQMERYISLDGDPSRITSLDDLKIAVEQNELLASKHMLSRQGEFELIGRVELEKKLKEEEKERETIEKAKEKETSAKLQLICRKQSQDPPDSFNTVDWRSIMGVDYNSFLALKANLSANPGNLDSRTKLSNILDAHYDPKKLDRAGREAVSDLSDYYSIPLDILHASEDDPNYDILAQDPDTILKERSAGRAKDEDRMEKLMDDMHTLCSSQSKELPVADTSPELKAALGSQYYEYLLYKADFDKDRESMEMRRKIIRFLTDAIESAPSTGAGDRNVALLSDLADYYSLPIELVFNNPQDIDLDITTIDINKLLEQQIEARAKIVEAASADKEDLSEKLRTIYREQPPEVPEIGADFNIKNYIGAANYDEFSACAKRLKEDAGDLVSRIKILQILSSFDRAKLKDMPMDKNDIFISIYRYYADPLTLLAKSAQ